MEGKTNFPKRQQATRNWN